MKNLHKNITIFSLFLLGALIIGYIFPPVFQSKANTIADGSEAYLASVSADDTVTISATPTSTQTIFTGTSTVSYTNTCDEGFYLYLSSDSEETDLVRSDDIDYKIPTISSGTALANNTWGYSINSGSTYNKIPVLSNPDTILDVTSTNTTANTLGVDFSIKIDNNVPAGSYEKTMVYTLVAKQSCYAYDVSWDANTGTNPEDLPDAVNLNGTLNLSALPRPTKNYYTFNGWSNGSTAFTGNETEADINPNDESSVTMTALWKPTDYEITYNLDGGEASNPETYNIESNTITLSAPTKRSYSFRGWSGTDLDGDDNTVVTIPTGSHDDRNYTANWDEACAFTSQDFDYTGNIQEWTVPANCEGIYILETWGAQGGRGGRGGYSKGNVTLAAGETIYAVVGGAGTYNYAMNIGSYGGGYNGGGNGYHSGWEGDWAWGIGAGGGATHFGKTNALLSATDSEDVFLVAGGGGGYFDGSSSHGDNTKHLAGGVGGGTTGGGGSYGRGASYGGGGGYQGGRSYSGNNGALGGTGYIGGVTSGTTINGNAAMPKIDGTGDESGHGGNGYARITYVGRGITITYDTLGGTLDSYTKFLPSVGEVGELPVPTKPGTFFWGWYSDPDFINFVTPETVVTNNITFYARWDANGLDLNYAGILQGFYIAETGTYRLEAWGAEGGKIGNYGGGRGGYAVGDIELEAGTMLYYAVGGKGGDSGVTHAGQAEYQNYCHGVAGGFNGGGAGSWGCHWNSMASGMASGGGATHVGKTNTLLSGTDPSDVLIVAAGGGGGGMKTGWTNEGDGYTNGSSGGFGGGLSGGSAEQRDMPWGATAGVGATQTTGYAFGQGASYGGGGGWYGGTGGSSLGGGGGSSYIDALSNASTIAGNKAMPTIDGSSTMTGNTGHGHLKITKL